ncbi:hypothetical protein [Nonomuraea dietziae]|uniref:hypothetical protein n=1 Tax=Nonomuraea dietziae TaxID=65515 RepID=UPI0033D2A031
MRPYKSVALGLLIVALDLRLNGFDLLMDVIGWVVVVAALGRVGHPAFHGARVAAVAAAVVSVTELMPLPSSLTLMLGLAEVLAVWMIATGIMVSHQDPRTAQVFGLLRWATVAAAGCGWLAAFTGAWPLAFAGLAVRLWLIVELLRAERVAPA